MQKFLRASQMGGEPWLSFSERGKYEALPQLLTQERGGEPNLCLAWSLFISLKLGLSWGCHLENREKRQVSKTASFSNLAWFHLWE